MCPPPPPPPSPPPPPLSAHFSLPGCKKVPPASPPPHSPGLLTDEGKDEADGGRGEGKSPRAEEEGGDTPSMAAGEEHVAVSNGCPRGHPTPLRKERSTSSMPPPPPPFHPLCLPPPPPMPLTPSGLRRIDPKPDGGAIRKTHFTLRTSTSTPMQRCHDHGGARRGRGEREGGTFVGCAGWMVRQGRHFQLANSKSRGGGHDCGGAGEWARGGA